MKQKNLEQLLQMAAQKLGTTPERLRQGVKNGELTSMVQGLDPKDEEQLRRVLEDREAAQKLLSSPQARALLKRLGFRQD